MKDIIKKHYYTFLTPLILFSVLKFSLFPQNKIAYAEEDIKQDHQRFQISAIERTVTEYYKTLGLPLPPNSLSITEIKQAFESIAPLDLAGPFTFLSLKNKINSVQKEFLFNHIQSQTVEKYIKKYVAYQQLETFHERYFYLDPNKEQHSFYEIVIKKQITLSEIIFNEANIILNLKNSGLANIQYRETLLSLLEKINPLPDSEAKRLTFIEVSSRLMSQLKSSMSLLTSKKFLEDIQITEKSFLEPTQTEKQRLWDKFFKGYIEKYNEEVQKRLNPLLEKNKDEVLNERSKQRNQENEALRKNRVKEFVKKYIEQSQLIMTTPEQFNEFLKSESPEAIPKKIRSNMEFDKVLKNLIEEFVGTYDRSLPQMLKEVEKEFERQIKKIIKESSKNKLVEKNVEKILELEILIERYIEILKNALDNEQRKKIESIPAYTSKEQWINLYIQSSKNKRLNKRLKKAANLHNKLYKEIYKKYGGVPRFELFHYYEYKLGKQKPSKTPAQEMFEKQALFEKRALIIERFGEPLKIELLKELTIQQAEQEKITIEMIQQARQARKESVEKGERLDILKEITFKIEFIQPPKEPVEKPENKETETKESSEKPSEEPRKPEETRTKENAEAPNQSNEEKKERIEKERNLRAAEEGLEILEQIRFKEYLEELRPGESLQQVLDKYRIDTLVSKFQKDTRFFNTTTSLANHTLGAVGFFGGIFMATFLIWGTDYNHSVYPATQLWDQLMSWEGVFSLAAFMALSALTYDAVTWGYIKFFFSSRSHIKNFKRVSFFARNLGLIFGAFGSQIVSYLARDPNVIKCVKALIEGKPKTPCTQAWENFSDPENSPALVANLSALVASSIATGVLFSGARHGIQSAASLSKTLTKHLSKFKFLSTTPQGFAIQTIAHMIVFFIIADYLDPFFYSITTKANPLGFDYSDPLVFARQLTQFHLLHFYKRGPFHTIYYENNQLIDPRPNQERIYNDWQKEAEQKLNHRIIYSSDALATYAVMNPATVHKFFLYKNYSCKELMENLVDLENKNTENLQVLLYLFNTKTNSAHADTNTTPTEGCLYNKNMKIITNHINLAYQKYRQNAILNHLIPHTTEHNKHFINYTSSFHQFQDIYSKIYYEYKKQQSKESIEIFSNLHSCHKIHEIDENTQLTPLNESLCNLSDLQIPKSYKRRFQNRSEQLPHPEDTLSSTLLSLICGHNPNHTKSINSKISGYFLESPPLFTPFKIVQIDNKKDRICGHSALRDAVDVPQSGEPFIIKEPAHKIPYQYNQKVLNPETGESTTEKIKDPNHLDFNKTKFTYKHGLRQDVIKAGQNYHVSQGNLTLTQKQWDEWDQWIRDTIRGSQSRPVSQGNLTFLTSEQLDDWIRWIQTGHLISSSSSTNVEAHTFTFPQKIDQYLNREHMDQVLKEVEEITATDIIEHKINEYLSIQLPYFNSDPNELVALDFSKAEKNKECLQNNIKKVINENIREAFTDIQKKGIHMKEMENITLQLTNLTGETFQSEKFKTDSFKLENNFLNALNDCYLPTTQDIKAFNNYITEKMKIKVLTKEIVNSKLRFLFSNDLSKRIPDDQSTNSETMCTTKELPPLTSSLCNMCKNKLSEKSKNLICSEMISILFFKESSAFFYNNQGLMDPKIPLLIQSVWALYPEWTDLLEILHFSNKEKNFLLLAFRLIKRLDLLEQTQINSEKENLAKSLSTLREPFKIRATLIFTRISNMINNSNSSPEDKENIISDIGKSIEKLLSEKLIEPFKTQLSPLLEIVKNPNLPPDQKKQNLIEKLKELFPEELITLLEQYLSNQTLSSEQINLLEQRYKRPFGLLYLTIENPYRHPPQALEIYLLTALLEKEATQLLASALNELPIVWIPEAFVPNKKESLEEHLFSIQFETFWNKKFGSTYWHNIQKSEDWYYQLLADDFSTHIKNSIPSDSSDFQILDSVNINSLDDSQDDFFSLPNASHIGCQLKNWFVGWFSESTSPCGSIYDSLSQEYNALETSFIEELNTYIKIALFMIENLEDKEQNQSIKEDLQEVKNTFIETLEKCLIRSEESAENKKRCTFVETNTTYVAIKSTLKKAAQKIIPSEEENTFNCDEQLSSFSIEHTSSLENQPKKNKHLAYCFLNQYFPTAINQLTTEIETYSRMETLSKITTKSRFN